MPVTEMIVVNLKRFKRPYVAPDFVGPVIRGGGDQTYVCGKCSTALLENVDWTRVRELAICCAKCGRVNGVPDPNAPPREKALFAKK